MVRNEEPKQKPSLTVGFDEAVAQLSEQIEKGRFLILQHTNIPNQTFFDDLEKDISKWYRYNKTMLTSLFTTDELAQEYTNTGRKSYSIGDDSLLEELKSSRESTERRVIALESILERLKFYRGGKPVTESEADISDNKIFIVHGHDESFTTAVENFLRHLGLEPIILAKKASSGKTLIEKFEVHSDVGFAVILFSADDYSASHRDLGGAMGDEEPTPENFKSFMKVFKSCPRPNVILELGYFIGKYGRRKTCVLYKSGTSILSDYAGVVYVPYNENNRDWERELARELDAAGMEFDKSRILE